MAGSTMEETRLLALRKGEGKRSQQTAGLANGGARKLMVRSSRFGCSLVGVLSIFAMESWWRDGGH